MINTASTISIYTIHNITPQNKTRSTSNIQTLPWEGAARPQASEQKKFAGLSLMEHIPYLQTQTHITQYIKSSTSAAFFRLSHRRRDEQQHLSAYLWQALTDASYTSRMDA
jgi:hypothetical protein